MRSSNEEVMRNLEDRRNRLAIDVDIKHRAWRDSYSKDGKGYIEGMTEENASKRFEAWTKAIEELNETEQALALMERIIEKEAKRNG